MVSRGEGESRPRGGVTSLSLGATELTASAASSASTPRPIRARIPAEPCPESWQAFWQASAAAAREPEPRHALAAAVRPSSCCSLAPQLASAPPSPPEPHPHPPTPPVPLLAPHLLRRLYSTRVR